MVFDFLWDLHQQRRIVDAESDAMEAVHAESRLRTRVAELEDRLNRAILVNHALWELLGPRLGLTDKDLAAKVQQIDLRDGAADGRISPPKIQSCPACNRANRGDKLRCLYCGQTLQPA